MKFRSSNWLLMTNLLDLDRWVDKVHNGKISENVCKWARYSFLFSSASPVLSSLDLVFFKFVDLFREIVDFRVDLRLLSVGMIKLRCQIIQLFLGFVQVFFLSFALSG